MIVKTIAAAVMFDGIMGSGVNHGFAMLDLLESNPELGICNGYVLTEGFLINGKFYTRDETEDLLCDPHNPSQYAESGALGYQLNRRSDLDVDSEDSYDGFHKSQEIFDRNVAKNKRNKSNA